ncbi:helix-turn-helix domain-containing protein [Gemmatimonas sp.]|uniref:helix-turn-helix domain-containing protein n=1 Tax=Gemmatimonas sp. TaxID=1962908 RepID=UPI003565EF86
MVRSRKKSEEPASERSSDSGLDVNAVVSYNVKAIRERRGWTQQSVAERLGLVTGHQLPQASISAMERGFDGERRRRFDAHELYLFSVVFDVPIAYFFVPPPGTGFELLADTGRPVSELYAALLGQESQLAPLDDRLAEIQIGNPEESDATLAAIFGAEGASRNWHESFRTWRKKRLAEIEHGYGDRLDEVALFLKEFATKIEALGPRGYLQSMAHREGESVLDSEEDAMSAKEILEQIETTRPEE